MEIKKKSSKDLEKKRLIFFQIGLIISLSFVFIAFEWRSYYNPKLEPGCYFPFEDDYFVILPEIKPPAAPKPKQILKEIVKVVPGNEPLIRDEIVDEPDSVVDLKTPDDILYTSPAPKPEVFVVVEQMPEFTGGIEALHRFLNKNLKYPEQQKQEKKTVTVFVQFVIETDGSVRIEQYTGGEIEFQKEALRVIKLMPNWQPGKQRNIPVPVYQTLPIIFSLK
ncbi:MAG: energy transducer TonB [Bacteroidota bacterium]|nr:energy transducer TonB [Bacteroidota bacterium]